MMNTFHDISATALLTLGCHALDASQSHPVLNDQKAIETAQWLNKHAGLKVPGKINRKLVTTIALRACKYDQVAAAFISKYPNASIVNIGCGFDNRFERLAIKSGHFFDLDLPDVISIRQRMVTNSERHKLISTSVFDENWMKKIPKSPVLFLAEGVFMYCKKTEVQQLLIDLGKHFGNYDIFFEVFSSAWTEGWRGRLTRLKLSKQLKFGPAASFTFGLRDSREPERWDEHLTFMSDWSALETNHPNLGVLRHFRNFDLFRNMQYSVYYRYHSMV
jgi:O-methyltransferase involved in polyketide biosynthesis